MGEQKCRYKLYKTRRGWQLSSLLVLTSGLLLGLQTAKADNLSSSNQAVTTATIEVNNVQTQAQNNTNSTATTSHASSVAATASSEEPVATADVVASQPELQSSQASNLTSQAVSPSATSEVASEASTTNSSATTTSEPEVEGNFEDEMPYDPYIGTVFQEPSEEEKQSWDYYREDFSLPAGMRVVQQVGNDERPTIIRVGLDDKINVISEDKSVVEPVIYIKDPDLEYGRVVQVRAPLYPGIVEVTSYSLGWGGTVYQGRTHRLRVNTIHPGIFKIGVKPKVDYDVTDYQTIYRANPNLEASQIRIVQKGINTVKQVSETLIGVKTDLGEHYGLDETVKNVLDWIEPSPTPAAEPVIENSDFDFPADFSSTNLFTSFFTTDGSVDLSPIFLNLTDIIGVGTEILGYLGTSTILQTINSGQDQIIEVGTKPTVTQNIIAYGTIYEATDTLPAGQQAEKQAGVAGIKTETTTYQLNEATGELTASKEVSTKASQTRIIRVGVKPKRQIQLVDYQTKYQADDTLPYGYQQVVQNGHKGLITTVTTYQVDKTGQVLPTVTVTKMNAQAQVIKVGTKSVQTVTERPYLTLYLADDSLAAGLRQEKQAGKKQVTLTTITYSLTIDGQVISHRQIQTLPGQAQIIKVGVKTKVLVVPSAFKVSYQADNTLAHGQRVITQFGKDSLTKYITTYSLNTDGSLNASENSQIILGQAQIIRVGVKPTSQQTIIPYQVIYQHDGQLEADKQVLLQAGKDGLFLKTIAYKLNEDGPLSPYVTTIILPELAQIIKVGTKVASPAQSATTKKEPETSQPKKTQAQPIPVPLVKTTAEDKLPAPSPLPTKTVTLALARMDGEIAQNLSKAELGLGNSDRDYQITGLVFKEVDQKLAQSVHQLGTIKAHHPRMLVLDSAVFESKWNWLLIGVLTIIGLICFKEDKKSKQ